MSKIEVFIYSSEKRIDLEIIENKEIIFDYDLINKDKNFSEISSYEEFLKYDKRFKIMELI